jgi:hypothetical protein
MRQRGVPCPGQVEGAWDLHRGLGVSVPMAPLVGGAAVEGISWQWIFSLTCRWRWCGRARAHAHARHARPRWFAIEVGTTGSNVVLGDSAFRQPFVAMAPPRDLQRPP